MCIETREALTWWTVDPLAIGLVTTSSAVYVRGLRELWSRQRSGGAGHGIRRWEAACFFAGQLSLLVALVSPVDRLSDLLFSAHMTQHEILMVVAPPLFVLGRPWIALLWAMPDELRARAARVLRRPSLVRTWRRATGPLLAVLLHALVVWLWHVPDLFEAAMRNEAIHSVQHASFFASATLFWWAILRGRYGRLGYGLAVAFVFATAMHTSVLGALITVAGGLWYPIYAARGAPFELDALGDQALAGVIMWVPAGVVLTLAALALFAAWLGEAGRRVALAERRRST